MNNPDPCLANFINGNLTDACQQARRVRSIVLYQALRARFGKTEGQALAIVKYLKAPSAETWRAACLADLDKSQPYTPPRTLEPFARYYDHP